MIHIKTIHEVVFSPAGSTRTIAGQVVQTLAQLLEAETIVHDYTLPKNREEQMAFAEGDLVVWASPVYAGRLPNKLLDYVKCCFRGAGVPVLPLVVYGNRNFDQALSELTGILREGGMVPFAAAAVPTRHVFSDTLGAGRPDREDLEELKAFTKAAGKKLVQAESVSLLQEVEVPGLYPPDRYYTPLTEDGRPAKFLKALPVIDRETCTGCGSCENCCPMDSITMGEDGAPSVAGICIKCQACIGACPAHAIALEDADFHSHRKMLEKTFRERKKASFLL